VHAGRNIAYSDNAKKQRQGCANFDFDLLGFDFQELGAYFRILETSKWKKKAFSFIEIDRGKIIARSVMCILAEI